MIMYDIQRRILLLRLTIFWFFSWHSQVLHRQNNLVTAAYIPITTTKINQKINQHSKHTLLFNKRDGDGSNIVEMASVKLTWEKLRESQQKPILNLSGRDASPEDTTSEKETNENMSDCSDWDCGQRWEVTQAGLKGLGINVSESFLEKCPQLFRLESNAILETAEYVLGEFNRQSAVIKLIESEPRILSYPRDDVEYGLKFISMMMMVKDAKPFLQAAPELFLSGIDGGIQERAVQQAMGAAADATNKANQKIASDALSSLRMIQNKRIGNN